MADAFNLISAAMVVYTNEWLAQIIAQLHIVVYNGLWCPAPALIRLRYAVAQIINHNEIHYTKAPTIFTIFNIWLCSQ